MVTVPNTVSPVNTGQAVLTTPAVSNSWQLGTVLKALVLSTNGDGLVQLQIGSRTLSAQTTLSLQSGQSLRLQVAETGRTVLLKAVDQGNNDPVRAAMRQDLPRQRPQTALLASALSLSRASTQFPAALRDGATQLVSAMRDPEMLTQGKGLRLAVRDSGTFLEARLAAAAHTPTRQVTRMLSGDWKAALLQFRNVLTQQQISLSGNGAGRPLQSAGSTMPGQTAGAALQSVPAGFANAPRSGTFVPSGLPGAVANANVNIAVSSVQTPSSGVAGNVNGIAAGAQLGIAGTTVISPLAVTAIGETAGSLLPNPSSIDPAKQPPVASQQYSRSAGELSPPMRHVLPQGQPITQAGALSADPLNLISDLISNNDGALARVRLNQMASLATDQGNRMVWLLELPVRHADNLAEVVTMRIEKDQEGSDTQEKSDWTADLAFDLGAKGQLRARVALRAGRVSVLFWADAEQTRAKVQDELPQLKTAMEKKQLDVANLSAGIGHPETKPASPASLFETKA